MPLLRRDVATARTVTHPDLLETEPVASVTTAVSNQLRDNPGTIVPAG